jgi:hypothetical protein
LNLAPLLQGSVQAASTLLLALAAPAATCMCTLVRAPALAAEALCWAHAALQLAAWRVM